MAGADLSLVTVGLSLTVANGFPSLQEEKWEKKVKPKSLLSEKWTFHSQVTFLTQKRRALLIHSSEKPVKVRENKSFMTTNPPTKY